MDNWSIKLRATKPDNRRNSPFARFAVGRSRRILSYSLVLCKATIVFNTTVVALQNDKMIFVSGYNNPLLQFYRIILWEFYKIITG